MKYLIISCFCIGLFACTEEVQPPDPPPFPNLVYDPTPLVFDYPETFPIMEIPEDNPTTVEGAFLGRMLYYDPALHPENEMSCASCHIQEQAFSSPGGVLAHINLGWNNVFLWNGLVEGTLEDIMLFEVEEFFQTDLNRLQQHDDYPSLFYEAFGTSTITSELAANAMAQFQRTLSSTNSKYDRFLAPDLPVFFTADELYGLDIFFSEKGDCFHCHGGILFTDNAFHNNGLDEDPAHALYEVSGDELDIGKFKTPTLRNIELTAPYMHDDRYQTLEEVIEFYSSGLVYSPTVDPLMKNVHLGGIQLTEDEKGYLLAFLKTLTDTTYVNNPDLSSPF